MAKVIATVKGCPIIHNGKHYDIGSRIELDDTDVAKIALYLDNVQPVQAVKNESKSANKPVNKATETKVEETQEKETKAEKAKTE